MPDIDLNPHVWYEQGELTQRLGVSLKTLKRAGIPNARLHARRVRAYLGHSAGNMTETYLRGDVTPYLMGDARDLRAYLGLPNQPTRLEVTG